MRRTLAAVLLVGTLALCTALPAAAEGERTLGLSAAKFDFTAAVGQTGKGTVWVSADGDSPVSVRVYAADQVIDSKGVVVYKTPTLGTNVLQSPASWMTVTLPPDAKSSANIPYVNMKPGQRLKVDFQVKIPAGAIPGDHNILLFFETFQPEVATGVGSNARLGARVKARVEGEIVEKVDVAPFYMPSFVLGSSVPYDFTINNKGNVDERATARLLELNSSDAEVSTSDVVTDTAVYANSSLQKVGALKLGATKIGRVRYKLTVVYASQTNNANGLTKSVEAERLVWVCPRWVAYAAVAVFILLLAYVTWSAGRGSARRKARLEMRRSSRVGRRTPADSYGDSEE